MRLEEKLTEVIKKYADIEDALMSPSLQIAEMTALLKQKGNMEELVNAGKEYMAQAKAVGDLKEFLRDPDLDEEMKKEIEKEIFSIDASMTATEKKVKILLLPKSEEDASNAIMEIRPCAGGDEAGLFAVELFTMYRHFSENNKWKFEILSQVYNDVGGLKEAFILITGKNVFAKLKFESGIHRVQRIPKTEGNGRIHTSTVSVAVLPEMDESTVKIPTTDIRVDVYRSSGAGGQHVNTTDSAVRMVHIPTGITVMQQDEKSQIKNREKAYKILCARVNEAELQKKRSEIESQRRSQIGTGDRSEKIRTYNYPQDRITDHRVDSNVHDVVNVVKNGLIENLINQLIQEEEMQALVASGLADEGNNT